MFASEIDDEHIDWAQTSHCTTLCAVCALKMKMTNGASLSSDQVDDYKRLNGTFCFCIQIQMCPIHATCIIKRKYVKVKKN